MHKKNVISNCIRLRFKRVRVRVNLLIEEAGKKELQFFFSTLSAKNRLLVAGVLVLILGSERHQGGSCCELHVFPEVA